MSITHYEKQERRFLSLCHTQMGNDIRNRLAYMALLRLLLECGTVGWDPYRNGQVSALNRVRKRAVKFAININVSPWETLEQRRLIAKYALFSRHTPWEMLGKR